jgi:hypothetical protein
LDELQGTTMPTLAVLKPPPAPLGRATAPSSVKAVFFSQFITDGQKLILHAVATSHGFLSSDDFNLQVDDSENSNAKQFLAILDSCNLTKLLNFLTQRYGHTLDFIITATNPALFPVISHSLISPSDNFPIFCELIVQPPCPSPVKHISLRHVDAIQIPNFFVTFFLLLSSTILLLFRTL